MKTGAKVQKKLCGKLMIKTQEEVIHSFPYFTGGSRKSTNINFIIEYVDIKGGKKALNRNLNFDDYLKIIGFLDSGSTMAFNDTWDLDKLKDISYAKFESEHLNETIEMNREL